MIPHDLIHRDDFAKFRNPLSARVGYHLGDNFGCAPCAFKWFDSVGELIAHILTVELPLCDYDEDERNYFHGRLDQVLRSADDEGLTEERRDSLNQVDWGFTMHWWGTLQDLLSGQTEFSREILDSFSARNGGGRDIAPGSMPAFVEFLRNSCRHGSQADAIPEDTNSSAGLPAEHPRRESPRH